MNYAVIESGGKQYRVSEGDTILVDYITREKGETYEFPHILLVNYDEAIQIGTPYIDNCKVSGKVIDNIKGEKIRVGKFKSKVHYRRVIGYRSLLSKVLIEKIHPAGGDKREHSKNKKNI
ncbi:MAG: 50S ribosomal protein L21 [Patescibacteria group bacterium]|nr:50S ribosomal protein L21 [Patescibacteria group bacterium]